MQLKFIMKRMFSCTTDIFVKFYLSLLLNLGIGLDSWSFSYLDFDIWWIWPWNTLKCLWDFIPTYPHDFEWQGRTCNYYFDQFLEVPRFLHDIHSVPFMAFWCSKWRYSVCSMRMSVFPLHCLHFFYMFFALWWLWGNLSTITWLLNQRP